MSQVGSPRPTNRWDMYNAQQDNYAPNNNGQPTEANSLRGNPYVAGGAGLLSLIGGIGGFNSTEALHFDEYDPAHTALARYNELQDPNSGHHQRLKALYSKYFAEGSPTLNTLLGVSRAAGIDEGSSTALAYQQSRAQTKQNSESTLTALQRQQLSDEQNATQYLGMHYNMLSENSRQNAEARLRAQESQGSFFDQMLGLGGSILGKVLI